MLCLTRYPPYITCYNPFRSNCLASLRLSSPHLTGKKWEKQLLVQCGWTSKISLNCWNRPLQPLDEFRVNVILLYRTSCDSHFVLRLQRTLQVEITLHHSLSISSPTLPLFLSISLTTSTVWRRWSLIHSLSLPSHHYFLLLLLILFVVEICFQSLTTGSFGEILLTQMSLGDWPTWFFFLSFFLVSSFPSFFFSVFLCSFLHICISIFLSCFFVCLFLFFFHSFFTILIPSFAEFDPILFIFT